MNGSLDAVMTHTARVTAVRAAIADTVLPPRPSAALGSITLAPHQVDAAARLLAILAEHGGALLADDVGLGKTYVALAVARAYDECHVLAPPALLPMWASAIARGGTSPIRTHSLHGASRRALPPFATRPRTLVVIDEAHHLRNPNTTRYRHIAQAIAGADVLLLSATPLHNRPRDVQALLALFVGTRPDLAGESWRARLIVRRDASVLRGSEKPTPASDRAEKAGAMGAPPPVRRHRPRRLPMDDGTLTRIMSLPAPLPARDGTAAGALIRMGLLRAWCSSDAALAQAIRHRRLRGGALRDALRAGRHPNAAELRSWAIGDQESQLAFAELLAPTTEENGSLLAVLERHLAALEELSEHHRRQQDLDAVRASILRRVLDRHRDTPVVAFSQHARTVHAMYRALRDIAGVGMLTGTTARIASGRIPRWEALQRFAPRAHQRPPPPAHQAIRLLLSTDLLAEGVNLQDAGVVVHLDLPWTAALRDQRVGRCARLGSTHTVVHVYRLAPAEHVERVLQLELRVLRKAADAARLLGNHTGTAARTASRTASRTAAPQRVSALHAALEPWRNTGAGVLDAGIGATTPPTVAAQRARSRGALVVVEQGGRSFVVAVRRRQRRWRASTGAAALLALVRSTGDPVRPADITSGMAREVRRAVKRWLQRAEFRRSAGTAPVGLSDMQRRVLVRLVSVAGRLGPAERRAAGAQLQSARAAVLAARSPAAERALAAWMRRDAPTVTEWLATCPIVPARTADADRTGPTRIVHVLLLVPG